LIATGSALIAFGAYLSMSGKLYLRRQHFYGSCRGVKNGERDCHLLLFFRRLSNRNPQQLAFPMGIVEPSSVSSCCSRLLGFSWGVAAGRPSGATFFVSPTSKLG